MTDFYHTFIILYQVHDYEQHNGQIQNVASSDENSYRLQIFQELAKRLDFVGNMLSSFRVTLQPHTK